MENLRVVEKDGQRVLTTSQIAAAYGTDNRRISENFNRNKERFSQGKHFIVLTGDSKRDFLNHTQIEDGSKNASSIYLWTERGALLHAKSLNTDEAWNAYETLVDSYFDINTLVYQPSYMIDDPIQRAQKWIEEQKEKQHLLVQNQQKDQKIEELQPKATYYDLILQTKSLLSVSQIAKDYGMSAISFNKLLHKLGIQYKQGDCWLLYQKYADKGYTHTKTHVVDSEKSKVHTYWTQKGRTFIYETLKDENILPVIERMAS
ncbi:phage antirepressor KilAC domain-containing protein [Priestia aryabhattai]